MIAQEPIFIGLLDCFRDTLENICSGKTFTVERIGNWGTGVVGGGGGGGSIKSLKTAKAVNEGPACLYVVRWISHEI